MIGVYDSVRIWNQKNYLEITAFLPIEQGISRLGKFKVMLHFPASEMCSVFVFIWIFHSWSCSFKMIFSIPYPITYITLAHTYCVNSSDFDTIKHWRILFLTKLGFEAEQRCCLMKFNEAKLLKLKDAKEFASLLCNFRL